MGISISEFYFLVLNGRNSKDVVSATCQIYTNLFHNNDKYKEDFNRGLFQHKFELQLKFVLYFALLFFIMLT